MNNNDDIITVDNIKLPNNRIIQNLNQYKNISNHFFNSDQLLENKYKRQNEKMLYYSYYFDKCCKAILIADKKNLRDIIFAVPLNKIQCESYVSIECMEYISTKLKEQSLNT